jgi:HAD superfamily phosphoserine phosphatase-like hydrolase
MAQKALTPKRDGIAFFDLDGTLRSGNLAEWFGFLKQHGIIKDDIWRRMLKEDKALRQEHQNLRQFATNIMNLYATALREVPVVAIEHLAGEFVKDPKLLRLHDFSEPLVSMMNEHCITTLVTGQPIEVARAIARKLGITDCTGTELEVRNGVYTGRVLVNNSVFHQKRRSILALADKYRTFIKKSFAFGDTAEDAIMLGAVRVPVAVNPNKELEQIAHNRGWIVIRGPGIIEKVGVALRTHYLMKTRLADRQGRKIRYKRIQRNVRRSRPRIK